MLQAIRTRAGGIVVKVLFGLLILSFGFWGIYTRSDFFSSKSPDTVIATVGDQDIRADQLQTQLDQMTESLRAQFGSIDPQQLKQFGLVDTVLNRLIERSLIEQEVARLKLDVSDDVIRGMIFGNPAFRGPDGHFDAERFRQMLFQNRMTEQQFLAEMHRDVPADYLLQAVTAGAATPPAIVDVLYRYRNEKRIADIVALPLSGVTDVGTPSDADLDAFYEAHKDEFRTPEFRGFTLISLTPADVEKTIKVSEDRLRAEYEQHKDAFQTPERRDIQQIRASSKEKIDAAAAALAQGKDWNEVATTIAGMSPDTIDLGMVKQSELPKELGDAAFDLPLNTPSQPIDTPLGWHILRVVKIEPAGDMSFDQVKDKLAAQIAHEDAIDQVYKVANQVDDALAGGASLSEVAAKFGLKTTTVPAVDVSGRGPDGKPVELPLAPNEVLKAAFAAGNNEQTRVTETDNNGIFALHVDKVTPPEVKPLAEVKDKVVAAWQGEKKRQTVDQQAQALAGAVKPDAPLAAVAAQQKLTATTSPPLTRQQQPGGAVPPGLVGKLFQAKEGETVTFNDPTGAYVAQLKQIQVPETTPAPEAKALTGKLDQALQAELASQFVQGLRKRFPVDIKRDVIDRMF
ncbi:MAG TPA: peptidyl-prolyl cis-trans isomerase [Stellaceae bacterium]|nr:peptidyl-prolyl cis-trans isomerase [Stellaceae bacterium]